MPFMPVANYPSSLSARAIDPPGTLPEGFVLLDVREQNEWDAGHAPNARSFPMSKIPGNLEQFPKENTLVICRTGGRSSQLTEWLALKDIRVWNVRDGMVGWRLAGHPIVKDDGTPGTVL